ncbi:MAG: isoleucine--tRNA ligase [Deltaproteobacteria bacterium]|jgi:isoleucyl-tRNA synthetase|nr:isoleucine--tRNA ligase [Deltaproteobacteria bacterium]
MKTVGKSVSFPEMEEQILEKWRKGNHFKKSVAQRKNSEEYVFFDGPPFANNLPHYGHLLAGIIKDIIPRYWTMRGYHVDRRFGWDTHGLPVEMEIEKELGIVGQDIKDIGIDKFNEACRASVLKYSKEWERTVLRTGRWVDFENRYLTMQSSFMESVWWVFKNLWDNDLIYEGHRVLPYSVGCHTPLSNFEASSDYRDVQDPAITLTMPLVDRPEVKMLVWTTTPWTLPSNLAVAAHPDIDYVEIEDKSDSTHYIMAKSLISSFFKKKTDYEIIKEMKGHELEGIQYTPLFDFFAELADEGAFRVVIDDYVTAEDGTGLVHLAPAYGEDDYRVCSRDNIPMVDPVNNDGKFTSEVKNWAGMYIKDADPLIIKNLKNRQRLVKHKTLVHSYPYCERSGYPLIYKAMPVWFVNVKKIKDKIIANNKLTNWVPEHIKTGRFGKWLEGARDWNISRNRYWGTPIPLFRCNNEECEHIDVAGSIAELEKLSGEKIDDLHMHMIDHLSWKCPKCGGEVKRISEVLDCWFESGSMPYAQYHYPFENKEKVEKGLPADFIAEGLDQTRGWFYTLMILSTALFDKPAFKNVVVNGLILAEDGKKMSKRLQNYPAPDSILDQHGADALRLYLINSGLVKAEDLKFSEKGVRDVVRLILLPLWNAYRFFLTYAIIDNFDPQTIPEHLPSDNVLDRWILSRVETLNRKVQEEMDKYRLFKVVPALVEFIDDLTNWYIRLNRRRFWKPGLLKDKLQAYSTLHEVLRHFSLIMAPFTPFLAEEIYCNLTDADFIDNSVHLQDFPKPETAKMDKKLEHSFALMQEAILIGRSLREQHNIGVRQPLSRLTLINSDPEELQNFKPLIPVISEELNIKEILFTTNESEFVSLVAKPNLSFMGPRFGKKMKFLINAIRNLPSVILKKVEAGENIEVEGETLTPECFLIEREAKEDSVVQAGQHISVALDTRITPELKLEGLAREALNRIQRTRKEIGLEVEDRIHFRYQTDDKNLAEALKKHDEYIANEILAKSFKKMNNKAEYIINNFDIDGANFTIGIKKA